MKNVISVDVEQWFHRFVFRGLLEDTDSRPNTSRHVVEASRKILDVFRRYDKRTTFFVLGEIADLFPELVKEIIEGGHEVAFHGYSHAELNEMGVNEFKAEVEKGCRRLYDIAGQKVVGFRAPDFSLNNETIWALQVLRNKGFKYDSSLFPTTTPSIGVGPRYGLSGGISHPYFPSPLDLTKENPNEGIIEFPMLIRKIGFFNVPAAGGFYLRLFGPKFILDGIRNMNKRGYPAMCYVHPWEVCGFPRVDMPIHRKFYAYYKIPCFDLFERLVRNTDVAPAVEVLERIGF